MMVPAGWYLVHQALNKDMALMAKALQVVAKQLESGRNLEPWQKEGLSTFWLRFGENLHAHHKHEEDFFFPWMATKMQMPERMADDHKVLLNTHSSRTLSLLTDMWSPDMYVLCKVLL
jgi:hemerythrin-like domain-containing protein